MDAKRLVYIAPAKNAPERAQNSREVGKILVSLNSYVSTLKEKDLGYSKPSNN